MLSLLFSNQSQLPGTCINHSTHFSSWIQSPLRVILEAIGNENEWRPSAQKPTMAVKNDHRAIFCCRARIFGTFVAQRLGLTFYIVCEGTRTGSLLPPKHGNFIMFLMNENHPFWGNQCWNYQWRVPIQECLLGFPGPRKKNGLLVPCMCPWLAERW